MKSNAHARRLLALVPKKRQRRYVTIGADGLIGRFDQLPMLCFIYYPKGRNLGEFEV